MRIASVRASTIRIPLPRPIRTSNLSIEAREYVLVDVASEEGLAGRGFGFTRGGLVAETIEKNLAPLLVGSDARLVERLWERMYLGTRYLGRRGLMMRAISAVDIALWDLKGKAAKAPLWTLLGGYRERVPAFAAGGYYGPSNTPDEVEVEFRGYREAGFQGGKLNVGGLPLEEDVERVAAARRGLGPDRMLGADFNGALASARQARSWAEALRAHRVSFLEEPFLMDDRPSIRAFGQHSPIDVAMGEDESGRWAFADLLSGPGVDILRHDATLVGGISEWLKVASLGLAHRLTLFPHWFPEVHIHLAAALPSTLGVELITPESGIMNLHELMVNPVTQTDGFATVPDGPGLGIAWERDVVETFTVVPGGPQEGVRGSGNHDLDGQLRASHGHDAERAPHEGGETR